MQNWRDELNSITTTKTDCFETSWCRGHVCFISYTQCHLEAVIRPEVTLMNSTIGCTKFKTPCRDGSLFGWLTLIIWLVPKKFQALAKQPVSLIIGTQINLWSWWCRPSLPTRFAVSDSYQDESETARSVHGGLPEIASACLRMPTWLLEFVLSMKFGR